MGTFKKAMSILMLVFFVVSLTAASASAGSWRDNWKDKRDCDCDRDKCDFDCHKDKCDCDCDRDKCDRGCKEDKCNFDFLSFFGLDFFGTGWNGVDGWNNGVDGWNNGVDGLWG